MPRRHSKTRRVSPMWRSKSGVQSRRSVSREVLHASKTPVLYETERTFTKSVHVLDPDENEIELYVDTSGAVPNRGSPDG